MGLKPARAEDACCPRWPCWPCCPSCSMPPPCVAAIRHTGSHANHRSSLARLSRLTPQARSFQTVVDACARSKISSVCPQHHLKNTCTSIITGLLIGCATNKHHNLHHSPYYLHSLPPNQLQATDSEANKPVIIIVPGPPSPTLHGPSSAVSNARQQRAISHLTIYLYQTDHPDHLEHCH